MIALKPYIDKALAFLAGALSEENGRPSSRRVVLVASIFAAIFFCAGLLIKHPEMCVDLIKFVILTVAGLFGGSRVAEAALENRKPPGVILNK